MSFDSVYVDLGKQESSNLTGFLKDPRIQKKMSPLVRFRVKIKLSVKLTLMLIIISIYDT